MQHISPKNRNQIDFLSLEDLVESDNNTAVSPMRELVVVSPINIIFSKLQISIGENRFFNKFSFLCKVEVKTKN